MVRKFKMDDVWAVSQIHIALINPSGYIDFGEFKKRWEEAIGASFQDHRGNRHFGFHPSQLENRLDDIVPQASSQEKELLTRVNCAEGYRLTMQQYYEHLEKMYSHNKLFH